MPVKDLDSGPVAQKFSNRFTTLGGKFELQPTGQNKLVATIDLSLSKRISIGCRLAKFTTTKKYTVQIYDSADCKNLKTKLTLKAFDTKT